GLVSHFVSLAGATLLGHRLDSSRGLWPGRLVHAPRNRPRWWHEWPADGELLPRAHPCQFDSVAPESSRSVLLDQCTGTGDLILRLRHGFCAGALLGTSPRCLARLIAVFTPLAGTAPARWRK